MTGMLSKVMPVTSLSTSSVRVDDELDVEFSIAMEYNGPPITFDIPKVVPVHIGRVPTASTVVPGFVINDDVSVPVIQPLGKSDPSKKKLVLESKKSGFEEGYKKASLGRRKKDSLICKKSGLAEESKSVAVSVNDDAALPTSSDGVGSSAWSRFSDGSSRSQGSWASSGILEVCIKENVEIQDCTQDGISRGSNVNCEIEEENCEIEAPGHARKASVVTFRDCDSTDSGGEESVYYSHEDATRIRPVAERRGKKGSCYRCCKGNRFTEKEICIVCGAKFCSCCVVRAMGAMPEGRKCITCIGFPIDESRREILGKCSWLIKRLLTKSQVKQIMSSEKLSKVNQLQPEFIRVNGKRLSQEELDLLRTCSNPPKHLKPGSYWYDKVSGLWGKEGHKPWQMISPQLNVGNVLTREASNGTTNIRINNREITKRELWMLWYANVVCEGYPHFWVDANGSYQEEGQNNVIGKLWDKRGMKLVCVLLSLPTPPATKMPASAKIPAVNEPALPEEKFLTKFLLVGSSKSGAGTIFKQAKILYNVPFSEDESQKIKFVIQSNVYNYLASLLEYRERFEEENMVQLRRKRSETDEAGPSGQDDEKSVYSMGAKLKEFSDWLIQVKMYGNMDTIFPASAREYAPVVEELWKDAAIQATYNRISDYEMLPRAARYFLDRVIDTSRTDYEPSTADIVYAEGITLSNGLASMEFSFPRLPRDGSTKPPYQHDPSINYQLIRVHAKSLGSNGKHLEMFEDVSIVIFCVSMTDYDQFSEDGTNKMLAGKALFEKFVTHSSFANKNFLLILNRFDLLEEKIEESPLTVCEWFDDFHPMLSNNTNCTASVNTNPPLAQLAFNYIAVKFKRLYSSLAGDDRRLYVARTTGLEPDTVDEALRYARDILKWEVEKPNFAQTQTTEVSSYSNENSTSA